MFKNNYVTEVPIYISAYLPACFTASVYTQSM